MTVRIARLWGLALVTLGLLGSLEAAAADGLSGLWDGTIRFDETPVRFTIELATDGTSASGSFFNGEERVSSTGGSFSAGELTLDFDHYATRLHATLHDGRLTGTYGNSRYGDHGIELHPHAAPAAWRGKVPEVGGLWTLPFESPKGEHAFRLILRQDGPLISAAILRVDGDTGLLTGAYDGTRFVLDHFDGARALTLQLTPRKDGTLDVTTVGFHAPRQQLVAVRAAVAQQQGLPAPADFTTHTRVRNPLEPLAFSFPDLQGRLVSNTDPQFRNKVVIVNITGSWCPNCHDEAPFLADLYRRYHALGLEVVGIDFEDAEQLQSLTRLHAFLKRYGIEYTYLLAGTPDQLRDRFPQAENLNSWPTTFFVGRDGLVHAVHTGFAGAASGEFHAQLEKEVTATLEGLLAQ